MGITANGLSICASSMAGSDLVVACGVGIGSTVFVSGNTALVSEFDRNLYSSADLATPEQVTFTTDWSPIEVSGLVLKEHGMFTTGNIMLNREVLVGSLVLTGEEELQIQSKIIYKI